jgi:multimeric flavodoxin WrbA
MQIAVLNGSPKALTSVTMQYVLFLQKKFPQHTFHILNVCHDIKKLEESQDAFQEVLAVVQAADVVLWATPVYVLLVPGPYKRFIELVFERSAQSAFVGKYTAVLTTSVRFFDHTAHNYLNAICDDLGMRFAGSYSAEMFDLVKEPERKRMLHFWGDVLRAAESHRPAQRRHWPVTASEFCYAPGPPADKLPATRRMIVVLTDAQEHNTNLQHMVRRFRECFADAVEVVNIHQIKMLGGCLGCIHCSFDNVCVYRDSDDVHDVYRKLMAADIVVEAAVIKDRFLSARWKTLWDRGFFNNHIPILAGKQTGYLISGPLAQIHNLREVLETFAEVGQANLAGIVTDECGNSGELDRLVEDLARRLVAAAEAGYIRPMTFLGKGGKKILRDEIWAGLRCVFPLDHRYYKRHGLYDFPRRSLTTRARDAFFGLMMKIPSFRQKFQAKMREGMIRPLVKVVEEA